MGFNRLTANQAASFRDKIRPMLHFLLRCRRRLDARGFDPNSTLYKAVDAAYSAFHRLHIELHYQTCRRGVGRPQDED
jgi:hypothetical protein